MDETMLLPSPNWFLVSAMAGSLDGWVVYGGPTKSLCVLEPLPPGNNVIHREHNGYRAHLFGKVHMERVTAIDLSPSWSSEKKSFISGAGDGQVKQWSLEKNDNALVLKSIQNHSIHLKDQEEVTAVGYSTDKFAITLAANGKLVKWDLLSNIIKSYDIIISKLKPTCMACSAHILLQVAVGTKQGIVLVVDLSDSGKTLFKVRCHDDEVLSLSWCPQYSVSMKTIFSNTTKTQQQKKSVNERMERIRQEANKEENEVFDDSAITKTLPEDSFDETLVVDEDDLFDVYKDHEEEEFGHKKYMPEVITVKEEEPKSKELDYLAECQKLKEQILRNKELEPSINSLVDAFDKTHVTDDVSNPESDLPKTNMDGFREQQQNHLLASIGKSGGLRVWSKNGKLLGSGLLQNKLYHNKHPNHKINQPLWATLCWYKPGVLLVTDARGQLLQCNPLKIDGRNKVTNWVLVDTIHRRGTFCIMTNAPRVQNSIGAENDNHTSHEDDQDKNRNALPEDQWYVWTAAQDRTIVCYSMTKNRKILTYNTCGASVYNIQTCPYDAKRMAISVGDGAVRIWQTDMSESEDSLTFGQVHSYWQNVQGKVLTVAWHPTRENIVAFATAESRVGLLDISGNSEKPARVLNIGISGSVYSLCWGESNELYICGGADINVYRFRKDVEPIVISVVLEGLKWRLTAATWYPTGLLCGSFNGAVALLSSTTYEIQAVVFVFKKLVNNIQWHPQYISSSNEESSLKDLIAVASMDKSCEIAILKHTENEDGTHLLEIYKMLVGHKGLVLQLAWSPHKEGQLASTSNDGTVRVWDVESGAVTAIFGGHKHNSISLAWSAFPQLPNVLITGGSDFCVRIWKLDDYPPEAYIEPPPVTMISRKERCRRAKDKRQQERIAEGQIITDDATESEALYGEGKTAEQISVRPNVSKRFLMPITGKQIARCTVLAARKLAQKYLVKEEREEERTENESEETNGEEDPELNYDTDFLKMFGTINEVNELLDMEMTHHLETKDTDAAIMLAIFRGQIASMIEYAKDKEMLCPFLVSLSPTVSYKYWKDVTQLHLAQINRLMAQGLDQKLVYSRAYGGTVYRKAAMLLAVHDVRGAVNCLMEARLFRDAYVLCRVRHMESIAQETLWHWLNDTVSNGYLKMSIICYIALGELNKASEILAGISKDDESWLSLAVDLAKVTGQHTFADHLNDKKEQIKQAPKTQETEETLENLPSRTELLLKDVDKRIEHKETKE